MCSGLYRLSVKHYTIWCSGFVFLQSDAVAMRYIYIYDTL